MKNLNLIFAMLGVVILSNFSPMNHYNSKNGVNYIFLRGKIMYTTSYCGGVCPPPEVIQSCETPRPYKNSNFKLYDETTKNAHYFTTNDKGFFALNIEPGNYKLYPAKMQGQQNIGGYFCDCELWLNTILSSITVPKNDDTTFVVVYVHLKCDPCSETPVLRP